MAVSKEFLDVFKWNVIPAHSAKLGKANALLTKCFDSDEFWAGLKNNHDDLKQKYSCSLKLDEEFEQEVENMQRALQEQY